MPQRSPLAASRSRIQAELQGIADGLKAQGSPLDLWDVVALNGVMELSDYYLPWLKAKEISRTRRDAVAPGKCSALIATGSATKDGKIVIAHSNWSSYAEGERWSIVFDIVPASGQHLLMDGLPGVITSAGRLRRECKWADDHRDDATHGKRFQC